MGWLKNYFDTDFHGDHEEGDEYASNIEYDANPTDLSIRGTYTLSIYRVRGGKQGKKPVYVKTQDVGYGYGNNSRTIERALERESDEWVQSQTGIHDS